MGSSIMNPALKTRLLAAAASGAVGIAMAIGNWYEGTGPTVKQTDGTLLYKVYKDPVGIPTVCHGVTGADVIPSKLYTQAECDVLERKHYARAEAAARRLFPAYETYNDWIRAALIDWLYNLGDNAKTQGSTLRAKFNRGDVDGGCAELQRWNKARPAGKQVVMPGLTDRRATDQDICLNWGRP